MAEGDPQAWGLFTKLYSSLIYARCRARGIKPQDAADVVQEVFQRVHRAIAEFRREEGGQPFRRWLRTITRNVITDHFRESARLPMLSGNMSIEALADSVSDTAADLPAMLADSVSVSILRQLLDAIRIDYEHKTWQAFWLTSVENIPGNEVARQLGLTHGAVRQARYKILRRIKLELDDVL